MEGVLKLLVTVPAVFGQVEQDVALVQVLGGEAEPQVFLVLVEELMQGGVTQPGIRGVEPLLEKEVGRVL